MPSATSKLADDDQVVPPQPTPDTSAVPKGQKGYDDFREGVVNLTSGKTKPKNPGF